MNIFHQPKNPITPVSLYDNHLDVSVNMRDTRNSFSAREKNHSSPEQKKESPIWRLYKKDYT
jgi:hypothetical protein